MNENPLPTRYHPAIAILHWLIAVIVISQIPLGFLQIGTQGPLYHTINLFHVNLGFTLLLLVVAQIGIRLHVGAPPRLPGTPSWTHVLARTNHVLLYAVVIIQTFMGLAVTDAQGYPLEWLDLIPIWDPIGKSPVRVVLLEVHRGLAFLLVALIALHVAGALYHRVVLRDTTLARIT